jgi:N-acyl-D-aspartate/D-glutamate deacylase
MHGLAFKADVPVGDGRVVSIERDISRGREEIDATGRVITPGLVENHSHYEGQMTWDNTLPPSSSHGVATVVTGDCGVKFAPIRAGETARQQLIDIETAAQYGLSDRAQIEVRLRADLNVLDLDRLKLYGPRMVYDLTAGGNRFVRDSIGYVAISVAGQAVRSHDADTGVRPGGLLRDLGGRP